MLDINVWTRPTIRQCQNASCIQILNAGLKFITCFLLVLNSIFVEYAFWKQQNKLNKMFTKQRYCFSPNCFCLRICLSQYFSCAIQNTPSVWKYLNTLQWFLERFLIFCNNYFRKPSQFQCKHVWKYRTLFKPNSVSKSWDKKFKVKREIKFCSTC